MTDPNPSVCSACGTHPNATQFCLALKLFFCEPCHAKIHPRMSKRFTRGAT